MLKRCAFLIPFTVTVFLLQTLLPFFAAHSLPIADAKALTELYGDTVLLCTPQGPELVSWDDAIKKPRPSHAHYQCGLCYLAAHGLGNLAVPGSIVLAHAARTVLTAIVAEAAPHTGRLHRSSVQSRAPPFFLP